MFIVYLSQGLLSVTAFFYPFEDGCFELCINWPCTSSDVEAGFNYPISKKILLRLFCKPSTRCTQLGVRG
jgi:hypothetical protein